MPSNSRRRKAAKKKKGNDPNNIKSSSALDSTENDDLRNQEEKDSDGGENEVSLVSEGNDQDQFPEGSNELEKRVDLPPVGCVASESISWEGDTVDLKEVHTVGLDLEGNRILEDNVKEMKPEDVPESGSVNAVCDESVEVLTNGYHEEHNGIDRNSEPRFDVETELVNPENATLEAPKSDNFIVDPVFIALEKVIHDATEVALSEALVDSGLDLKENREKELKPRDYSSEITQNVLNVSSEVEECVESVAAVSEVVLHVTKPVPDETIIGSASYLKENEKELQTREYSSQVPQTPLDISSNVEEYILSASVPIVESCLDKSVLTPPVSDKVIHVSETAPVETMVDSGSDLKENGNEVVVPVEGLIGFDKAAISERVIYMNGTAPTENVDKELLTGDCSVQTPNILLDILSEVQESADKLSTFAAKDEAIQKEYQSLPISDSSTVRAGSSVESSKEPESYEILENQPLTETAPRQVEKTSWFGCCGIFNLLSGTR